MKSEYFAMIFFAYQQTSVNNTICDYLSLHAHAVFGLQKMLESFGKTHNFLRLSFQRGAHHDCRKPQLT